MIECFHDIYRSVHQGRRTGPWASPVCRVGILARGYLQIALTCHHDPGIVRSDVRGEVEVHTRTVLIVGTKQRVVPVHLKIQNYIVCDCVAFLIYFWSTFIWVIIMIYSFVLFDSLTS